MFVSLTTFQCYSDRYLHKYSQKSGDIFFLNIKRILNEERSKEREKKEVTKLAIGVKGGFEIDFEKDYDELHSLVCLDPINTVIRLPNDQIPEIYNLSIQGILGADSAEKKEEIKAWVDDKQIKDSAHAKNLYQFSPREDQYPVNCVDTKCELCDKTDNLWLCLTCGRTLCGRRYFNGTGGNNHMVDHYDVEKHPLVVKIGTITSEGADIFSYAEEDMVNDPYLRKHLAHWGIDQDKMIKTDLSMAELELKANKQLELTTITESGKELIPISGPGLTGISNLGNTCYLSSTMQILFSLPEWRERFFDIDFRLFDELSLNEDLNYNLDVQLTKLANGLLSGQYSSEIKSKNEDNTEAGYQVGISPRSFKNCIGLNHPEFSTGNQQDANEFFQYLLSKCEELRGGKALTNLFKFKTERRIECLASNMVSYKYEPELCIQLPIEIINAENYNEYKEYLSKLEQIENENEINKQIAIAESKPYTPQKLPERVTPVVSMKECFHVLGSPSLLESFYSTAVKSRVNATQTSRFATFPDLLSIQAQRYYMDKNTSKKLNVSLKDVEVLDLSHLRGTGIKEGEKQLPEDDGESEEISNPTFNLQLIDELVGMGFSEHHAKVAQLHGCTTADSTINFIFENQDNPILNESIPTSNLSHSGVSNKSGVSSNSSQVEEIISMGFEKDVAELALEKTKNNINAALEMIITNMDLLQKEIADKKNSKEQAQEDLPVKDGSGKYELFGMISHIGENTSTGHYVSHIKVNGEWIMFNDRRVVKSESPPFGLAFMYFYKRI